MGARVASGGGTGRTLHPDNMAAGPALALGASQRTVQRALASLESTGQARTTGRGRTQRWWAMPLSGFTTILLLPAALPGD